MLHRPRLLAVLMSLWPPFLGAGIRVRQIAPDWREVTVELRQRWYNRNYVGTHFGGSLFAMTDPFHMLMLMRHLGRDYRVLDQGAEVAFRKPGRGTVTARFRLEDDVIERVRWATKEGGKHLERFNVAVTDATGDVVADVCKTVYVRRRECPAARNRDVEAA